MSRSVFLMLIFFRKYSVFYNLPDYVETLFLNIFDSPIKSRNSKLSKLANWMKCTFVYIFSRNNVFHVKNRLKMPHHFEVWNKTIKFLRLDCRIFFARSLCIPTLRCNMLFSRVTKNIFTSVLRCKRQFLALATKNSII